MINFLQKRMHTLTNDFKGSISWVLDAFLSKASGLLSTTICYLSAWMWGVSLNKKVKFLGVAEFKKYPCSRIFISSGTTFRSNLRANFFGLNHACCISTHSKAAEIVIGENCGFSGTSISAYQSVKIGEHVLCGANTVVTDFDWHPVRSKTLMASAPVVLEDNVWLGANCVVLKGVCIGENTIVGANSVVTRSLPANVLAAGNPAQVIRSLPEKKD